MQTLNLTVKTLLFTTFAMVAFAANSLLCRMALGEQLIDAASFSTIRLCSGAIMLLLIACISKIGKTAVRSGNWISAAMLFLYAICFSFAYHDLTAGTGAIILFGMVQVTMILSALTAGERPHPLQWLGLALAVIGLIVLVAPGIEAPSLQGSALMATAGIAWGVYSLRGRGTASPLASTTGNFILSIPLVVVSSLMLFNHLDLTNKGALLAVTSGAITSGIGYSIWYVAVKGLSVTQAAIVQLCVPILAAVGGVIFLAEPVTTRFAISAVLILGGVTLAVLIHQSISPKALTKKAPNPEDRRSS